MDLKKDSKNKVATCLECKYVDSIECKTCYVRVFEPGGAYGIYTKFKSIYDKKGKIKN